MSRAATLSLGAASTVAILAAVITFGLPSANVIVTADAAAETRGHGTAPSGTVQSGNTPYDGRFTFVRIRFGTGLSSGSFRGRGRQPPWAHDFPRAERNFMNIIRETTLIRPYMDGGNIFDTDDPELTRFPLAYISEPGFWHPSDEEILGLRNYLMKGGFLIADDFDGPDWFNFDAQMRKVIPGAQFVRLDESHPIFDAFFRIESLATLLPPYSRSGRLPVYLGLHEDNDPEKRLVVIANYNNDIGEYWEFSDVGWYPIDLSNEAYKLGVNYVIYAMTH